MTNRYDFDEMASELEDSEAAKKEDFKDAAKLVDSYRKAVSRSVRTGLMRNMADPDLFEGPLRGKHHDSKDREDEIRRSILDAIINGPK